MEQKNINYNHSEYLPNTQSRVNRLQKIIAGRPVAILAAGPSINELEKRIGELSEADICYFGMNTFFVQEDYILKKIDKHFSVLIGSFDGNHGDFSNLFNRIINYLDRNEDNLLVSSFMKFNVLGSDFNLQGFLDKYDKKLLSPCNVADRTVPDNTRPLHLINGNSLSGLIYLAIIGKASKIILFGADGYAKKNDKEIYYRPEEYYPSKEQGDEPQQQLMRNTNKGFNPVVPISLRNIYKTYQLEPVPILNCSEVSFYTPFPKVSYNDGFDLLLGKKTDQEITDLRIPTTSIIISSDEDETKLKSTFKNISEQSYSNYETIVIQNKNSLSFLNSMRNALSLAKGKHVFYCPAGNKYKDYNWINSCLEVLENRPQISLVCGFPQKNKPPWPKKRFLYYWLKRKSFFPPNAICVRKDVLEKCLSKINDTSADAELDNWLNFSLYFNVEGYLPAFLPTIVDGPEFTNKNSESLYAYGRNVDKYKNLLIFKKTSHHFRDGNGNILPGKFYLSTYLIPEFFYPHLDNIKRVVTKLYRK